MDVLQARVDALKREQLRRLVAFAPRSFDGTDERLGRATRAGLAAFNRVASRMTWLTPMVEQILALVAADPRYGFLDAIPDGPVLSMARASALEAVAFGDTTEEVEEIALQLGLFSVLLDGLLDEVPEDLAPALGWLTSAMDPASWDRPLPPAPRLPHLPVTDALCQLAGSIIGTVVSQPGWQGSAVLRQQFGAATRDAFGAEIGSTTMTFSSGGDSSEMLERIIAKSTAPIWAGALLPMCVRGWPAGLDPEAFHAAATAIGRFGGWVDDVVDVKVDLQSDRWSAVLLELDLCAQSLGLPRGADPRMSIAAALDSPLSVHLLARAGVERAADVRASLVAIGFAPDLIVDSVCDMAFACLTVGLPEPVR